MRFFLLLFISITSFAGVKTYDVYGSKKTSFSFSQVCQHAFGKESPLIDIESSKELSCMGKKTNVVDFCQKKITKDLVRGYIDLKKKKVICQSGNRIVFKYDCKSNKSYCTSTSACKHVKADLALSLELVHGSVVDNNLNCYFTSTNDESSRPINNSL